MPAPTNSFAKIVMRLAMAFCMVLPAAASSQTANSQQTQENANVTSNDFSGTWQLSDSIALKNQRTRAIENTTASLGRFKRRHAFEVLQKMTAPAKELKIVDGGNQIQFLRAGREVKVGTDGLPVTMDSPRGKAILRAEKRNGKLIVESKLVNAMTTVVYDLSDDGNTLKQQVEIEANELPTPIRFMNSYQR